jgi:hypothetical protein
VGRPASRSACCTSASGALRTTLAFSGRAKAPSLMVVAVTAPGLTRETPAAGVDT